MDSINKNQPEENHEDLRAGKAAEKIKELIEKNKSCFFRTQQATGESEGVRPMSVQKIDDDGVLWFLSPTDSHKNSELNMDPEVHLYFQGSTHSDFLYLNGRASISTDKTIIKELWEPTLKAWFTEGENDPRISVIKVTPDNGYYWDTKHGNAVAAVKIMFGALVGKTFDDSIEGRVSF
jgi:general stress protein 26